MSTEEGGRAKGRPGLDVVPWTTLRTRDGIPYRCQLRWNWDGGTAVQTPAPPVVGPHPAPEEPARPAAGGEVPGGARRWVKAAEAAGFQVKIMYSRGHWIDARGRTAGLVHLTTVRGRHADGRRFVATWRAPADGDGYRWATEGALIQPLRQVPLTAPKADPEASCLAAYLIHGRER